MRVLGFLLSCFVRGKTFLNSNSLSLELSFLVHECWEPGCLHVLLSAGQWPVLARTFIQVNSPTGTLSLKSNIQSPIFLLPHSSYLGRDPELVRVSRLKWIVAL